MADTDKNAALPEDRDGFRFRGGSAALDLAATLQARLSDAPRELLADARDLDRWIESAGLVAASPGASEADVAIARSLREAIFTLAGQARIGALDADARATLNRVAATPAAAPLLRADGRAGLSGSVATLLSSLAREAVQVFGGADAPPVRQCGSPTCTLYFIDTSRAGDRRWCSMAACGNRAKVAEFRRRKRGGAGEG